MQAGRNFFFQPNAETSLDNHGPCPSHCSAGLPYMNPVQELPCSPNQRYHFPIEGGIGIAQFNGEVFYYGNGYSEMHLSRPLSHIHGNPSRQSYGSMHCFYESELEDISGGSSPIIRSPGSRKHRKKVEKQGKKKHRKSLSSSALPSASKHSEEFNEKNLDQKCMKKLSSADFDIFADLDQTPEELDIESLLQEQHDLDATLTSGRGSTVPGHGYYNYESHSSKIYGDDEEEFMVDRGIWEFEIDEYFRRKHCEHGHPGNDENPHPPFRTSFSAYDINVQATIERRRSYYSLPGSTKSLENGLDTIHEQEAAELYSFEDYDPIGRYFDSQRSCRNYSPNIYENIGAALPNSCGREFLRSKTVASIPVRKYLSDQDVASSYGSGQTFVDSPPPQGHQTRNTLHPTQSAIWSHSDGVTLLPGQIQQRSHSAERRPKVRPAKLTRGTAWILGDDEDDAFSNPASSTSPRGSNCSSYVSPTGNPQVFYTTPPKMASSPGSDDRSRLDRSGSGKGSGLSRLARRLSQKERRNNTEERRRALRQRSVSLDCGDNRRSLNSSMLEPPDQDDRSLSIPASPSLPSKLSKNSSSPNLAGRLSRKSSGSKNRKSGSELDASMSRDKRKRSALDLLSLFDAVEHQDMDRAKDILENNTIDVNGLSEEELSPLDVAIMTNHVPMARMLLLHGAKENNRFEKSCESRMNKVKSLIEDVDKRISEVKSCIMNLSLNNSNSSASQHKDLKKQLTYWEFKHKLLKRMMTGLDNARSPEEPTNVRLSVVSSSALLVNYDEPISHNGAVVTGYKIEWSLSEDFSVLDGECSIDDPLNRSHCIPNLTSGMTYFVRVRAWNIKGYGEAAVTTPTSAVPSSWREVDNTLPRSLGKLHLLNDLFVNMKNSRPADASEIKDSHTPSSSPLHPRKSTMRKSIKNLFSSAPKFQKSLKRGVYLACVMCNDDRILMTNEDNLPILEVDESFSMSMLNSDIHWLMKIACTWEDVRSLRQDMDKSSSSGSVQFRCKMLQVVGQLQSVLGIQDLGRLYYQPFKDTNSGSVVLTIINSIKDAKAVNTTHVKWVSYNKVQKRLAGAPEFGTHELLLNSVSDMLRYQQSSSQSLPRGLYLGYLKLKSSVDMIRIMVPEKTPNVLPCTRIRDVPNVTKEEWQWLRSLSRNEVRCPPTPNQLSFQNDVASSCSKLLQQLGITEDQAVSHRLYDMEVIEMSNDIAFLLVLPPAESVCSVPGHHEEITQLPNYTMLPVQVFEMVHMMTYQPEFISRYTRLSSILEMDSHLAQQAHREAFSSEELTIAKERLDQLASFQQKLDENWKAMRWTMDIISHARDKNVRGGLPLSVVYAPPPSPENSPDILRKDIDVVTGLSVNDIGSSTCSDCGYHSDISGAECPPGKEVCQCSGAADGTEVWMKPKEQAGVLRVYAAYESGLARGTSVKLQVTPRTTSREVINLVVQQLNKAVLCKGLEGPVYSDDQEFCLVAVIGARERVLRDDYQPLQLQNPWTKGRLYVRFRSNVLAAIEQGQVTTV